MNILGNIKNILIIIPIASTLLLGYCNNQNLQEVDRLKNNATATSIQYETEKGNLANKVTEYRFTIDELKEASKKDSTQLSDTQKKLVEVNEIAKELGIKVKYLENANIADLSTSTDSLISEVEYNDDMSLKSLKPIKTEHIDINFTVKGDTILVDHKYHATLSIIGSREVDKLTKNNKKRFFLARWINPRWQYYATGVTDDKNAKLEITNINFQRKKGKR